MRRLGPPPYIGKGPQIINPTLVSNLLLYCTLQHMAVHFIRRRMFKLTPHSNEHDKRSHLCLRRLKHGDRTFAPGHYPTDKSHPRTISPEHSPHPNVELANEYLGYLIRRIIADVKL